MNGSTTGRILKMTTFGESHGEAIGVVLDGFPSGMRLCEEDIALYLERRRGGRSASSTARDEGDAIRILSGVFEGVTTGTPIAIIAENNAHRSGDYDALKDIYRPSHADYCYDAKFGIRDHRGGGRASGRETLARVAAGAVCQKLLKELGVDVTGYTRSIGPVSINDDILIPGEAGFDTDCLYNGACAMPDKEADERALKYLEELKKEGDSAGGVIQVVATGVRAGAGDPVFRKLDAELCAALMSIGGVKAVETGNGVMASGLKGSENNDLFLPGTDTERAIKSSNRGGGITGGISDGSPILLKAHVKPTPSIAKTQSTIDKNGAAKDIAIQGRHDPSIVPRAAVVAECVCAFVILDAMLARMTDRTDYIKQFYGR